MIILALALALLQDPAREEVVPERQLSEANFNAIIDRPCDALDAAAFEVFSAPEGWRQQGRQSRAAANLVETVDGRTSTDARSLGMLQVGLVTQANNAADRADRLEYLALQLIAIKVSLCEASRP